jgi:hypothetical protein
MINFKKKISNIILNDPRLKNNKNTIPDDWEDIVAPLNIKILNISSAIVGLLITIFLGILLSLIDVHILYSLLGFPIGFYRNYKSAIDKGDRFITIPNGHRGVITLFGNAKGELGVNNILLADGNFRQIADISVLITNIFGAVTLPKAFQSFEFTYVKSLSSDSVEFSGAHSFMGFITNPYIFTDFVLAAMEEDKKPLDAIKIYIENISRAALKNAYDEIPSYKIAGKKGTEKLIKQYRKALIDFDKFNKDCAPAKPEFVTGIIHQCHKPETIHDEAMDIPQIGITGSFLIETSELPEELQKLYNKAAGNKKMIENEKAKSKATAYDIEQRGIADAEAKRLLIETSAATTTAAAEDAYDRFHKMAVDAGKDATHSQIMQSARLSSGMVEKEFELILSGSNGETPQGVLANLGVPAGQSSDAILISLIRKFSLKKEFDDFFKKMSGLDDAGQVALLQKALTTT